MQRQEKQSGEDVGPKESHNETMLQIAPQGKSSLWLRRGKKPLRPIHSPVTVRRDFFVILLVLSCQTLMPVCCRSASSLDATLNYSHHIRNALDLLCPIPLCLLVLTSECINPCRIQKMRRGTMLTRVDQMSPFPDMPPGGALETPSVNDLRKRMAIFSTASWCDEAPSPAKRTCSDNMPHGVASHTTSADPGLRAEDGKNELSAKEQRSDEVLD